LFKLFLLASLVLAAVAQFLFGEAGDNEESSAALTVFQKSLKYGLPDTLTISCYDYGFADRVVAQRLCAQVRADGFAGQYFEPALAPHRSRIDEVLAELPSYFAAVLAGRSSS